MSEFSILFLVAFLVESVWETLKAALPGALKKWKKENGVPLDTIGVIIISIIVCIATSIDLFEMLGIDIAFPYIGSALTGIMVSRGSNFIHEMIDSLKAFRIKTKSLSQ